MTGRETIRAGHGIEAGASVICHSHLEANWGIRSGESIIASGAIRVGESVQAYEKIQAGEGYGIFAGLQVPFDDWATSAQIRASVRPERLMSGWWAGSLLA